MKNQAIQYLALDVHQATTVATVRDEQGSIRMRATVPTEAGAIVGLVRGLGARVHVVFEEGTQAQWLHDLLEPHAERVIVCNVRGRSEMTNKSDRIDADGLSEMLRVGSVKSVYHGGSSVLTLKELVRCYTNLVDDSTRVMLRIKALFAASRPAFVRRGSRSLPTTSLAPTFGRPTFPALGSLGHGCGSSTLCSSSGRRPRRP